MPTYRETEPDLIDCEPDRAAPERRIAGYDERPRERGHRPFERCVGSDGVGFRHPQAAVDGSRAT